MKETLPAELEAFKVPPLEVRVALIVFIDAVDDGFLKFDTMIVSLVEKEVKVNVIVIVCAVTVQEVTVKPVVV